MMRVLTSPEFLQSAWETLLAIIICASVLFVLISNAEAKGGE